MENISIGGRNNTHTHTVIGSHNGKVALIINIREEDIRHECRGQLQTRGWNFESDGKTKSVSRGEPNISILLSNKDKHNNYEIALQYAN